jgi:hypothetical protein
MNNKKLAIAFSLVLPLQAGAVDIELGTGFGTYRQQHDGVWYQSEWPHTLELNTNPLSIGISGERNGIRYRAEFLALGSAYSNSVATSDAKNGKYYALTCSDQCDLYKYTGRGSVSGVVLSASRPVPVMGVPFYAEAGAYVYVPVWKMTVSPTNENQTFTAEVAHESNLLVGPMLGFGVRHSGVDVGIRYLYVEATGDDYPAIYTSAVTVMFKVYF